MDNLRKCLKRKTVTFNYKVRKVLLSKTRFYEPWKKSEVETLIKVCQEVGSKLELVAKHFPGKSLR